MASDVKYGFVFELDDKGVLKFIDRATGKSQQLGNVGKKAGKKIQKANRDAGTSFKRMAASVLAAVGAYKALQLTLNGIQALARELTLRPIIIAANFETQRIQMLGFLGDMRTTRREMARLAEFAARTPFRFKDLTDANRKLLAFGGTALATQEHLTLLGDTAAEKGAEIQNLSIWFGRAYTAIKNGAPFNEVKQRLIELGIAMPGLFKQLETMRKLGYSTGEQWKTFLQLFQGSSGAMDRLSQTFNGRVSTMKDTWELFQKSIGDEGPLAVVKELVNEVIDLLDQFRGDKGLQAELGEKLARTILRVSKLLVDLGIVAVDVGDTINQIFKQINGEGFSKFLKDWVDGLREITSDIRKLVAGDSERQKTLDSLLEKAQELNSFNRIRLVLEKKLAEAEAAGNKDAIDDIKSKIAVNANFIKQAEKERGILKQSAEEEKARVDARSGALGGLRKNLEATSGRLDGLLGNLDQVTKDARAAEGALTVAAKAPLKPLQEYDERLALVGKTLRDKKPTVEALQTAQEALNSAYRDGAIELFNYGIAQFVLQKRIDEAHVKQGSQVLRGLRTESERVREQIEILETTAGALIRSGEKTQADIDAAIARLRERLLVSANKEADSIIRSTLPGKRAEEQIAVLEQYRDQLFVLAAQAAPAFRALFGLNIDTSELKAKIEEANLAILSLQESLVENGQPIFDYVGGLQSAFQQLFQGIQEGSIDAGAILKSLLTQAAGDLAAYLAKRTAAYFSADAAEEVLAKKKQARNAQGAVSDVVAGQASIHKAHAGIPFIGVALALGFIAVMMASISKGRKDARKVTAFADGGYADKPTYGVFGEAGGEYLTPKKNMNELIDELVVSRARLKGIPAGDVTGRQSAPATSGNPGLQVVLNQYGPTFNTERQFKRTLKDASRNFELEASR